MDTNFIERLIENFAFSSKKTNEYEFIKYIHENNHWNFFLNNFECKEPITNEFKEEFHLFWIEHGEFIRKLINNDRLLVNMLWKVLPPFEGQELTLYRGENIQRFAENRIGLCWTEDLKIAKMFSTRNACTNGGIILSGKFDKNSIIAGINSHSRYLGENEYTVDPFKLRSLQILKIS